MSDNVPTPHFMYTHAYSSPLCLFLFDLPRGVTLPLARYPPVPSDYKTAVKDDTLPSGHVIEAGWGVDYAPCER